MSKSPLNLYQVLIEEYNSQTNRPCLPSDFIPTKLAELGKQKRFTAITDEAELQRELNDAMVTEFYSWLHENKVRRSALCLSGGGIRSGTFALGLIQGLARHNLLSRFDYLSTVSGGGYIGSWLTAWIHRESDGLTGVTRKLKQRDLSSRIDPDPTPIRYLREYSSFLTPKVGLLSADTWTFVGIYLRNLFLNWLVFIPLLISALSIPRLIVSLTMAQAERRNQWYLPIKLWGWQQNIFGRHIFLALGFVLGVWSLAYINFNRPGVREMLKKRSRFWGSRGDQKSFLLYCLLPLVTSATLLTTYWAWSRETSHRSKHILLLIYFGIAFTLTAWLIASLILRRLFHWQEINKLEVVALVVGGVFAGLFFWVISLQKIGNPVIGYHSRFPWATWTGWMAWRTELYVCFGVPLFLLVFLLGATFFVGVSSFSTRIDEEDREWWSRFGAWVLIVVIGWSVAGMLVIFGPIALLSAPTLLASVGGVSGLLAVLLGYSSQTSAKPKPIDEKDKSPASLMSLLVARSLPVLALLFLAAFIAAISLATTGIIQGLALAADSLPKFNQDQWLTGVPPSLTTVMSASGRLVVVAPQDLGDLQIELDVSRQDFGRFKMNQRAEIVPDAYPNLKYTGSVTEIEPETDRNKATVIVRVKVDNPNEQLQAGTNVKVNFLPETGFSLYLQYIYPSITIPDTVTAAKIVHMNVLHHTSIWFSLILGLAMFGFGIALSKVINLNLFSLHAGYRNRLIRAFLGASRPDQERNPNPFTGFDAADNIHMHELRPGLLDDSDVLDPVQLAAALLDESQPLSSYLAKKNLLENLKAIPITVTASPRLTASLRNDLNGVMETERLYLLEAAAPLLRSERIAPAFTAINQEDDAICKDQGSLRSDYRLLLNRLILEAAYPHTIQPCRYPLPPYKLLHVVNTTLNLVGGANLAWQQRKAEPFSISPLHSGCFRLGYRSSRQYGGREIGGISLGTGAAISGAAASSNMGYYTTSPVLSLLLTLFNVRLGWWLGNPGPAGEDTYNLRAPKYSVAPLIDEAFGLTNDRNKYVYLTDGGHFENLAIYEMVLRRCQIIVVSDGAQDEDYHFSDLGNAVRKIRIDLGVPIEFAGMPIYANTPEHGQGMYWAIAKIRYSCIDGEGVQDGVLVYIKPAVYGSEPRDVLEYKKSYPAFPHQSTGDQFFDEPQFESYRMLGSFIMDQLCGDGPDELTLDKIVVNGFQRADDAGAVTRDFKQWFDKWQGLPPNPTAGGPTTSSTSSSPAAAVKES